MCYRVNCPRLLRYLPTEILTMLVHPWSDLYILLISTDEVSYGELRCVPDEFWYRKFKTL